MGNRRPGRFSGCWQWVLQMKQAIGLISFVWFEIELYRYIGWFISPFFTNEHI